MASWTSLWEATPAGTETPSLGDNHIRDLKLEVRSRLDQEHVILDTSSTGESIHRAGSARTYFQDAEPTLRPDGITSINSSDSGRLWVDSNDSNHLYVYDGTAGAFEEVSVGGGIVADDLDVGGDLTVGGGVEVTGTLTTGDESAPDVATGGLCINTNNSVGNGLTLKAESNFSHAMISKAEDDTYVLFRQAEFGEGGIGIHGFSSDRDGVIIKGAVSVEATGTGSGAHGAVMIDCAVRDGTSYTGIDEDSNILVVQNNEDTVFIIKGDGDVYIDGTVDAFDEEDDYSLVKAINHFEVESPFKRKARELNIVHGTKISLRRLMWLQLGTLSKLIDDVNQMKRGNNYAV